MCVRMGVVPLVEFKNGKYSLNTASATWLSSRVNKFAVLACAGKYRTGKSFFLNRFIDSPPNQGFGVGETVQACTRGIWMHDTFLPNGENDILVLDTEGIDALDAENENDACIFALSVLISSVFVYNSMAHLDEAAVQTLNLMTRVAETLGECGGHSPTLYWVLRDFSLQMVDIDGKPISHSQYLEQALNGPNEAKCATREAIKKVFPNRHLVTLPRPHKGESAQKLEQKGNSAIASKFDKFLGTFRSHVKENAKPFCAAGVPLSGAIFVEYINTLLDKVNVGGVIPKIEDSWALICKLQHREKEDNLLTELITIAEDTCPKTTEGGVVEWVSNLCTAHCAGVVFMPPAPHMDEIHTRLCDKVFRHCNALSRIVNVDEIAESTVSEFCCTLDIDITIRCPADTLRLFREFISVHDHCVQTRCNELLVANFFTDHILGKIVIASIQKGKQESILNYNIELNSTKETLKHTEAKLRDLMQREENTIVNRVTVQREDACVQTDAIPDTDSEWCASQVDSGRRVVELEERVATVLAEQQIAEEKITHYEERQRIMSMSFDATMEEMKKETIQHIEKMKRDKAVAISESKMHLDQKIVLAEESEKMRVTSREAQDIALDTHKSMLEELRRRDTEDRSRVDLQKLEWGELKVKAEIASQESRSLKRRIDELLVINEEAKRLRVVNHLLEIDKAKEEAGKESYKSVVQTVRGDNDSLRRLTFELENRLASAEATSKLEACRNSLSQL